MDDTSSTSTGKKNSNALKYAAAVVVVVIIAGVLFLGLRGSSKASPTTTIGTTIASTTVAAANTSTQSSSTAGSTVATTSTNSTIGSTTTIPSNSTSNLSVQMTDPPIVPQGTQSLIVTYSGVDLHETGMANSTGFVNFSVNGKINLMNLTNVSQTIAVIKTQANQSFNLLRFDIKSANITINNVTYNLVVATGGVIARINGTLNTTSSGGVLLDLSPTVLQIYNGSANQSVFILVPSASAIRIGKSNVGSTAYSVGGHVALSGKLAGAVFAARPNISITSASASEAGNVTTLHITVKNNGNSSVSLSDLDMKGFFEAVPTFGIGVKILENNINAEPMGYGQASAVAGLWHSGAYINTSANASGAVYVGSTTQLNASLNSSVLGDLSGRRNGYGSGGSVQSSGAAGLAVDEAEIFNRNFYNQLNFIVESNGTLELPYGVVMAECPVIIASGANATASGTNCQRNNLGYSLSAGNSVNLTFNGVITLPNVGIVVSAVAGMQNGSSTAGSGWVGPKIGGAVIVLIPNQTYSVAVHGQRGAYAWTNVTATGYITTHNSNLVDVTSVGLILNNTSSNKTYNETMAGFLSHTNATVAYSLYSYGGTYAIALPRLPSYALNVTGFQINTKGFVLLNYSKLPYLTPPCAICGGSKACPAATPSYACVYGTGSTYLLNIKMPPANYTGQLSITEDYKVANVIAANTAT